MFEDILKTIISKEGKLNITKENAQENMKDLLEILELILKKLIQEKKNVEKMPREIRALASFLSESSKEVEIATSTPALIGGFIFLRYFNPILISPQNYGLLENTKLNPIHRKDLTMVTRVLQKLATNTKFTTEHMNPVNKLIEEKWPSLTNYFTEISKDPLQKSWEDLMKPSSEFKLSSVDDDELGNFYSIFTKHREKIINSLNDKSNDNSEKELIKLLLDSNLPQEIRYWYDVLEFIYRDKKYINLMKALEQNLGPIVDLTKGLVKKKKKIDIGKNEP